MKRRFPLIRPVQISQTTSYQLSRLGVVGAVLGVYDKAGEAFDAALRELRDGLGKKADLETLLKAVSKSLTSLRTSLKRTKARHEKDLPVDKLHAQLTALLEGKVGPPYSSDVLSSRYQDATKRYRDKIPPGYKDSSKPEPDRYGDAIAWFQILDHAKAEAKPVVLVTGDLKEDWWWEERGKKQGPRPELRREMKDVAGVEFYMYSTERFLQNAGKHLGVRITDQAIAEAREVQSEAEPRPGAVTTPDSFNYWLRAPMVDMWKRPVTLGDLVDLEAQGGLSLFSRRGRGKNSAANLGFGGVEGPGPGLLGEQGSLPSGPSTPEGDAKKEEGSDD